MSTQFGDCYQSPQEDGATSIISLPKNQNYQENAWFTKLAGSVEFRPNQLKQFIEFQIPQEASVRSTTEFILKFRDILGEFNPVFGETDELKVTIINDIQLPRITFLQKEVTEYQMSGKINIPLCRTDNPDYEVHYRWKIKSENKFYHNMEGGGKFETGQINDKILLDTDNIASEEDLDTFIIELVEATSSVPCRIGKLSECLVILHYDKPSAQVEFTFPEITVLQSQNTVRCLVQRTENIEGVMKACWGVQAGTDSQYADLNGTITFEAGQTTAEIVIPMPKEAQSLRQEKFNVFLSEIESEQATVLGIKNVCTVSIDNDVRGPIIAFPEIYKTVSQSAGDKFSIGIQRLGGPEFCTFNMIMELADSKLSLPEDAMDCLNEWSQNLTFEVGQKILQPLFLNLPRIPIDNLEYFEVNLILQDIDCQVPADIDPDSSKMSITINCDLERPIVGFAQPTAEYNQTSNFAYIRVFRTGNLTVSTKFKYEIVSESIMSPYAGQNGELEYEPDDEEVCIAVKTYNKPRQPVKDRFRIKLFDIEGEFDPKFGIANLMVEIMNDRKVPLVEFETDTMAISQTEGNAKIPLIRSENTEEKALVQWYIETIPSGGLQPCGPFAGTETFEVGQTRTDIEIFVPGDVMNFDTGKFEIILLDPIENEIVTEVGPQNRCTVTVRCNAPKPEVTLVETQINCNRSDGLVRIKLKRIGADDVTTSVPYYATSKNFLEAEDNCYSGIVTFKPGYNEKNIVLKLEQYPFGFSHDDIDVELGDPIGPKFPRIGEHGYCLVRVANDLPPCLISFKEPEIICRQTEGSCLISVVRTGFSECDACVPWFIDSNTEGIIEFSKSQECAWIELPISQAISPNSDDVTFDINLSDMIECDYTSDLGELTICKMIIKMDKPRPLISLPQSKFIWKQSEGSLKVPVRRTEQFEGQVDVRYCIRPSPENENQQQSFIECSNDFQMLTFDGPNNDTQHIIIPMPNCAVTCNSETIIIELLEASGETYPQISGTAQAEADIIYDIARPKCFFEFSDFKAKQSECIVKIPILRNDQLIGSTRLSWKIRVNDFSSIPPELVGLAGEIEFEDGEAIQYLEFALPQNPKYEEYETLFVELSDVEGDNNPYIDEDHKICQIEIEYDIPRPKITLPVEKIEVKQSKSSVLIPIKRSGFLSSEVVVEYVIQSLMSAEDGGTVEEPITGHVIFDPFEYENEIEVPLPPNVRLPENETFRLKLTTVSGENFPFADGTFTNINIEYDIPRPNLKFVDTTVKVNQTTKTVSLGVMRSKNLNGVCKVNWIVDCAVGSFFFGKTGTIEFADQQDRATIDFELTDTAQLEDLEEVHIVLEFVEGDNFPEIDEDAKISVLQVTWDVPRPLVCLPQSLAQVSQTMEKVTIPVQRERQLNCETIVSYEIQSNLGPASTFHGLVGHLKFEKGEACKLITLELPLTPQLTEEEQLSVKLIKISGDQFPEIDQEQNESTIEVDYNIPRARIFIPQPVFSSKQSAGFAKIPIYRSENLSGEVEVSFKIVPHVDPESKEQIAFENFSVLEKEVKTSGKLIIADGESETEINLDIAKLPTSIDVENLAVHLIACSGELHPYIDEDKRDCLAEIILDIPRPEINIPQKLAFQEQEVSRLLGILEVPIQRDGFTDNITKYKWVLCSADDEEVIIDEGFQSFGVDSKESKIQIRLPSEVKAFDTEKMRVKLVMCEGEGEPMLGKFTAMDITVKNDIPRTEISLPSEDSIKPQVRSQGKVSVDILREREYATEVKVSYKIVNQDSGEIIRDDKIAFQPHESEKQVTFQLEQITVPDGDGTTKFLIEITKVEGEMLPIITKEVLTISVINDIPRPRFVADATNISVTQKQIIEDPNSNNCIKLEFNRLDQVRGENHMYYQIISVNDPEDHQIILEKTPLLFEVDQHMNFITIPIPDYPIAKVSDKFIVVIIDADGDDDPLIDLNQNEISVVVEYNMEPSALGFGVEEIKMFKTSGTCRIPVIRDGFNDFSAVVNYQIPEDNQAKKFKNSKGEIIFEEGQTTGYIELEAFSAIDLHEGLIPIQLELSEKFQLSTCHSIISRPMCNIKIVDDIPPQEVGFLNSNITVKQSEKGLSIIVRRLQGCDQRLRVPWKVVNKPNNQKYANMAGYIEFSPNDSNSFIKLQFDPMPQIGVEKDKLLISLGDPVFADKSTAFKAVLGHQDTLELEIVNDVLEPRIEFNQDHMTCELSTCPELQIMLIRSQELGVISKVKYSVEDPKDIIQEDQELTGEIYFPKGESMGLLVLALKQYPTEIAFSPIIIKISDPEGDMCPTIGECDTMKIKVLNDIKFPEVNFSSNIPAIVSQRNASTGPIELVRSQQFADERLEIEVQVSLPKDVSGEKAKFYPEKIKCIFEPGQTTSTFKLDLDPKELDTEEDVLVFTIAPIDQPPYVLGGKSQVELPIQNDIVVAEIGFTTHEIKVVQSKRICVLSLIRERCTFGALEVPWHIENASIHNMNKIAGLITFPDGVYEAKIEIELPNDPQEKDETDFECVLDNPVDNVKARLASANFLSVHVMNDVGVGIICFGEQYLEVVTSVEQGASVVIPILRAKGAAFNSLVKIEITGSNMDLIKHDTSVQFPMGQKRIDYPIEIQNVVSGGESKFQVKITEIVGRDTMGQDIICDLDVSHILAPPGQILYTEAYLEAPIDARIKWTDPEDGGPVERYVVLAWREQAPDDRFELVYEQDQNDVVIEGLLQDQGYCICIAGANRAGIGPLSDPCHIRTLPSLVLDYPKKRHFRSSERIGRIRVTRNITQFQQTVAWKLTKKRHISSQLSDVSTSSSNSDDADFFENEHVTTGTIIFSHGEHFADAILELEQAMKASREISELEMYLPATDKKQKQMLGYITVIVHNDTGRPGRIHSVHIQEIGANDVTITWKPPKSGAPPTGYKIICTNTETKSEIILNYPCDPLETDEDSLPESYTTTVKQLDPESFYTIKVQAINHDGIGKFSRPKQFKTVKELVLINQQKVYKMSAQTAVLTFERQRFDEAQNYVYAISRLTKDPNNKHNYIVEQPYGSWQDSYALVYEANQNQSDLILDMTKKFMTERHIILRVDITRENEQEQGKIRGSWTLDLINDLAPGMIGFEKTIVEIAAPTINQQVLDSEQVDTKSRGQNILNLNIIRQHGSDGPCIVHFHTENYGNYSFCKKTRKNLIINKHEHFFQHTSGSLKFGDKETQKSLKISLNPKFKFYKSREFKVIISKIESYGTVIDYNSSICSVRITPEELPTVTAEKYISINSKQMLYSIPVQPWLIKGFCYYTVFINEEGEEIEIESMSGEIEENTENLELDVTPICGLRGYCVLNVECPHNNRTLARSKIVFEENMICKFRLYPLSILKRNPTLLFFLKFNYFCF